MPGAFPCGEREQPPRSLVLPASRCSPGEELSLGRWRRGPEDTGRRIRGTDVRIRRRSGRRSGAGSHCWGRGPRTDQWGGSDLFGQKVDTFSA